MNFEEQASSLTTCDTCRFIAEQGGTTTALDAYDVLQRTQANLRARVAELECELSHARDAFSQALRQLRKAREALEEIAANDGSHAEYLRIAARNALAGEGKP